MSTLNKKISELPPADIGTLIGTERFEIIWSDGSSWFNQSMTLQDLVTILTSVAGGLPAGSAYQVLQIASDGATPVFDSYLYDNSGSVSFDINHRSIVNGDGEIAVDGTALALFSGPIPSVDWGANNNWDNNYTLSFSWGTRVAHDDLGYLSFQYSHGNKSLHGDTGEVALSTSLRAAYDHLGIEAFSFAHAERTLSAADGYVTYDFNARELKDSAGNLALNHDLRYGVDAFGDTIFSWLTGFQVNAFPWAFNGQSPSSTDTGWHPGTYSPLKTATMTSAMTAEDVGNMVVTLIHELINKGILAN